MLTSLQKKIVQNGVKNLKEFGYEHVDEENILTDEVYSLFFKRQLQDNLGHGFDKEINGLLELINQ